MRRPWRTTAWSSAIATRITAGSLQVDRRARARAPSAIAQRAAERLRPLLHRREPEAAGAQRGRVRIEADAVVGDGQGDGLGALVESDRARASAAAWRSALWSASCAILNSSSSTPGRSRGVAAVLERDRQAVHAPEHVDVLGQRRGQPLHLDRGGPQLEDERAQLPDRLLREPGDALDLAARAARRALQQRGGGLRGEHDAEQLLHHGVVQVAREPVALLDHAQLARALEQAGVLDRDRGVRGEHDDQPLVVVAERRRASLSVR